MVPIFSQLQTFGYLGTVESPSFTVDMDAAMLAKAAANSSGVVRLGSDDKSTLILKPQLDITKRLFSGANCGYLSANGQTVITNNAVQKFPGTVALAANQPFYISLMMFTDTSKADSNADVRIGFGSWRLLSYNGSLHIGYINENWNLTKETTALAGDTDAQGPRTKNGDDIGNPDAIFDIFQQVNLNDSAQGAVAGAYTYLWVIPQPGMGLYIATGRAPFTPKAPDVDIIEMPEWLASDTVVSAGTMSVYSKSTSFTIDGYALKFADAAIVAGPFSNGAINELVGDLTWNVNKDTPGGTSVETSELSMGSTSWAIKAQLNTDDNHIYTPFVYRVSAANPGGTFGNIATNQFDTSLELDGQGNPPILDVSMQCEGEMRRHSYDISIRFADVMVEQLTQKSALIENQIANLKMGLSMDALNPIITGGIIQPCGAFDCSWVDKDDAKTFHQWSELRGLLKDKWAIADDQILQKVLPGDGLRLGAYLIYVLGLIGFKASEIAISADTGDILPQAKFGEQPCVVPRDQQSGGDYLRELMDCYGFTLMLFVDATGKWFLEDTPSSIATVGGVAAEFSSDWTRNDNTTYPGRLAILSELDWIRDSRDFYNAVSVEGGIVKGNQLFANYIDQRSIYDPTAPNFIGRFKPMPTVRNEAWRTKDVCLKVVRSLALRYAISSRMYQFDTYFHIELFANDKIKLDGKLCRIRSIGSASIRDDRMSIVAQEIQ